MSDIVTFLKARLDESAQKAEKRRALAALLRQQAQEVSELHGDADPPEDDMKPADKLWWTASDAADELERSADELAADVAAKRRMLDELYPEIESADKAIEGEWNSGPDNADALLKMLALTFDDHADYQDKWRPQW